MRPEGRDPGVHRELATKHEPRIAADKVSKEANLAAKEYTAPEFDVRDGVAHVTLNRPEAANALNLQLAQELLGADRE